MDPAKLGSKPLLLGVPNKHASKLFKTKYSSEELEYMADLFKKFKVSDLQPVYRPRSAEGTDPGEVVSRDFMRAGSDKLKIDLTNAQHVINQQQNLPGKILVFDTRSQYQYHLSHIENSINFPLNLCQDDFFIKWDQKKISTEIIKNKMKRGLFDQRRRMFVYIIASQSEINPMQLHKLPDIFSTERLMQLFDQLAQKVKQHQDGSTRTADESKVDVGSDGPDAGSATPKTPVDDGAAASLLSCIEDAKRQRKEQHQALLMENILSLRNALLLYKALKNERIREVAICIDGFDTFREKYPYVCKYRTAFLYPRNFIANTFPSEILEGRLYLGDCNHAQDKTILQNLKITHVLNVSNNIPNFFEDDGNMDLEYLRINIEDNSSVPIRLSFPVAFQFIDGAFAESTLLKKDKSLRNNALVDDYCVTMQNKIKNQQKRARALTTAASLCPLEVDFAAGGQTERKQVKRLEVAHHIDSTVAAFNRVSFNNNVVYVHCAMGVSRSASCVLMYIMKRFKVSFDQALDFVKERRNVVDPNEGFVRQLKDFEASGMEFHATGTPKFMTGHSTFSGAADLREDGESEGKQQVFQVGQGKEFVFKRGRTTMFK